MTGRLEHPAERGRIRLLGGLQWSEDPSSECHRAYLGPFIVEQLEAGYLTYLDWRILRGLEGLAKRLWVYLESRTFKRSDIGEGAAALQLAPPMLQALGVTTSISLTPVRCSSAPARGSPWPTSRLSALSYEAPTVAEGPGRWSRVDG